ncbi:uncharacterized protein LOC143347765 [Colletes latitarsis]|uniref:uncharacterized protein LOC143347765 n=1 Tax=Colletes latitarsis TaxID=2605962 RepID=UPI0040370976
MFKFNCALEHWDITIPSPFRNSSKTEEVPGYQRLLHKEWIATFQEERDELRVQASESIAKVQQKNKRTFDKGRRKARVYCEGDLVAIKRTQRDPGLKMAHKYLGTYEVIRVLRNQCYLVQKIGEEEGPQQTSTSADFMKLWISSESEESMEEENNAIDEDIRDRMSKQDGRL